MSNGKGSASRPLAVPPDEYERRWKQTFQRTPMTNEPVPTPIPPEPPESEHE